MFTTVVFTVYCVPPRLWVSGPGPGTSAWFKWSGWFSSVSHMITEVAGLS